MAMEIEILTTLNFEMNVPTPIRFLEFFLWALGKENDAETLDFCKFLLDIALLENWQQKYSPSVLAAAAIRCAS